MFFGLLPALSAGRIDVGSALVNGGTRSVAQSSGTRARYALIIGEIALTVVLLTVAGLLIRTLIYLRTLPPGFNPENVVVAKASLDDARYNDRASFLKLLDESTAAMQNISGVQSAAVGLSVPYERALNYAVRVADGPQSGDQDMTNLVYVTPAYFEALQISLRAGRLLAASDTPNSQYVAVVNAAFAKRYLGRESSVGRHLLSDGNTIEIVGISGERGHSAWLYCRRSHRCRTYGLCACDPDADTVGQPCARLVSTQLDRSYSRQLCGYRPADTAGSRPSGS